MVTKVEFTEYEAVEIYYAVLDKLHAPVVQGDDKVSRDWRADLKSIIAKIGDDGKNLVRVEARLN